MTHEKNLLSMPSPLHFIRVVAGVSLQRWSIGTIVADRHEQIFSPNDSRYQRDISREGSGSAYSELIVGFGNFASDRWKLRNCGLSTDVDKAVSNSNLNLDFRLLTIQGGVQRKEEVKE